MTSGWTSPDSWQKDGASLSGVSSMKKGAWTSYYKATETHNGKSTDVVIKTFAVPEDVLQDPQRIAAEREKFLNAARLQKALTDAGARGWVKVLRLAEDVQNPSFSMEKCGPSVQDMIDNRAQLSAKELYTLVQSILQALIELKDRHKRSHGNIKPSDVLSARPGEHPPYKLADPSAKGEDHSANDLYSLGLILYELIEHREWDPLNPITPTKHWNRFGGKRDRWIQFCNLLLNPNGCHEPLADVRKEAYRLKPSSPLKYVVLAVSAAGLIGAGAVGYHLLISRVIQSTQQNQQVANTNQPDKNTANASSGQPTGAANVTPPPATNVATINTGGPGTPPAVDPAVKAAYDAAHQAYTDVRTRWTARPNTPRYDHTKSVALARDARALIPDQVVLTTDALRDASTAYKNATAKMEEALAQATAEEEAGQGLDMAAFTDLQRSQQEYLKAKAQWESAAAKFSPTHDHTRSIALAKAATPPPGAPPTDPVLAKAAANDYRAAAAKLADALALIPQEESTGAAQDQVRVAFEDARKAYQAARDQWTAAEAAKDVDLTAARGAAQEAKALLPDQIVLSDADSYRTAADLYQKAAQKLQQAVSLVDQQRQTQGQRQTEIATAVANANQALKDKQYADAFTWYKKAADLGNPPAMRNVGLLYETGQGVERDYGQAASWYKKAAEAKYPPAMMDLALLFENGRGMERDYAQAAAWYKQAAAAKNVDAMNHLGYLYENGWGVNQDYAEAMRWYRQAAELNDPTAMVDIGVLYEKGRGTRADPAEALKWYRKAAELGSAPAMNAVGTLYDSGRGVKTDYAEALKWYQKAADLNFAPAMCNIGVLHDNGLGVRANPAEAMRWFSKAAAGGHGLSMYNIAFLYERGRGVQPDLVQAVQWYRRAFKSDDESARQLSAEALDRLGYSHESTPPPRPVNPG
jgi:TPR repeat protein